MSLTFRGAFGLSLALAFAASASASAEGPALIFEPLSSEQGGARVALLGHGSLLFEYAGLRIYVDPVGMFAKGDGLPKADIILVTHEHPDHLDPALVKRLSSSGTEVFSNASSAPSLPGAKVLANGDAVSSKGLSILAVPAYNVSKGREQFHPKGRGNGYVLSLGATKVYVAGDTEDIPELARLSGVDVAFLPVNQPYTMTIEQASRAVSLLSPKIVYPYHLGDTDLSALAKALSGLPGTEARIRDIK